MNNHLPTSLQGKRLSRDFTPRLRPLLQRILKTSGGNLFQGNTATKPSRAISITTRILTSVENIKHRAILMLVYSAGLRVGEVVKLKPEDIDSTRMLIHVRGAKGRKDRYTMLSETA